MPLADGCGGGQPWDNTSLKVAQLADDGASVVAGTTVTVAGGPDANESVVHPLWDRAGRLLFLSDRADWWNLYRATVHPRVAVEPLLVRPSELCDPHWVFQRPPYAFVDADETRLAVSYGEGTELVLATLDLRTGSLNRISTGFANHRGLARVPGAAGDTVAVLAGDPARPAAVVTVATARGSGGATDTPPRIIQVARPATLDPGYISVPRTVAFPTTGGLTAYGYYYAPYNRDHVAPRMCRAWCHGGGAA
jgi:dipeptidyl aminopeptidase/acylaminoacyl peptidase